MLSLFSVIGMLAVAGLAVALYFILTQYRVTFTKKVTKKNFFN